MSCAKHRIFGNSVLIARGMNHVELNVLFLALRSCTIGSSVSGSSPLCLFPHCQIVGFYPHSIISLFELHIRLGFIVYSALIINSFPRRSRPLCTLFKRSLWDTMSTANELFQCLPNNHVVCSLPELTIARCKNTMIHVVLEFFILRSSKRAMLDSQSPNHPTLGMLCNR